MIHLQREIQKYSFNRVILLKLVLNFVKLCVKLFGKFKILHGH